MEGGLNIIKNVNHMYALSVPPAGKCYRVNTLAPRRSQNSTGRSVAGSNLLQYDTWFFFFFCCVLHNRYTFCALCTCYQSVFFFFSIETLSIFGIFITDLQLWLFREIPCGFLMFKECRMQLHASRPEPDVDKSRLGDTCRQSAGVTDISYGETLKPPLRIIVYHTPRYRKTIQIA